MFVTLWAVCEVGVSAAAERPCPPVLSTSQDVQVVAGTSSCNRQSDTPDYVDPVAGITSLGGRTLVNAANSAALTAALDNARCGQTIQLASATYSGTFNVDLSCPANNPLIVRGAANFGSIISSLLTMSGARNIVTGIHFSGSGAGVRVAGVNNKWIGNKLTGWTSKSGVSVGDTVGQTQNEIAYNEIGPGGPVAAGQFRWGIKAYTSSDSDSVPTKVWVHHNRLRDFVSEDGRSDAMEIGESGRYPFAPTFAAGWYIEDNLFTNMQDSGQAILDMKFGGSVIRRNTVSDSSNVRIQSRFGSNNIWESNYMTSGGILTNSRGHKVGCNFVSGSGGGIQINAGEVEWDTLSNLHGRAYDVLVAKNIGTLRVGHTPNSDYTLPAFGTTIEEHTGSISFGRETSTHDNRTSTSGYNCAPAVQLTTADVGPSALTSAPSAYRAARGL